MIYNPLGIHPAMRLLGQMVFLSLGVSGIATLSSAVGGTSRKWNITLVLKRNVLSNRENIHGKGNMAE